MSGIRHLGELDVINHLEKTWTFTLLTWIDRNNGIKRRQWKN